MGRLGELSSASSWACEPIESLSTASTPTLSVNPLALLDAADRAEVQTQLQTLTTKLNEIIAAINAAHVLKQE